MDRYEGFHEFVRARRQSLMWTAYLLTGDTHLAEDLLQTVLTRVASHWPKLAKGGNPEAYARKALVNQNISWRRRKQVERREPSFRRSASRTTRRPCGGSPYFWKAPLKQPKQDFAVEYTLRMSPNGLRFIVSGWGGRREPNMLVDVERGTVEEMDRGWWPVSVADGDGPVVLAKPYDKTTQVWVRGRKPVTIPTFTYDCRPGAVDRQWPMR